MRMPAERLILIVGGGPAADLIREFDRVHRLGDDTAHILALNALDLTAHMLAAILPGCLAIDRIEALPSAWDTGVVPILTPRPILDVIDRSGPESGLEPLAASWNVTSDSIAARIAVYLNADSLILLKSASVPAGTSREQAAQLGLIDPAFPSIAMALRNVAYLNLREPSDAVVDLSG
jgi:aspartokinase-like uncharacterized kinase